MINPRCPILKVAGAGFCWTPSEAWGVSDEELCRLCKLKQADKAGKERKDLRICRACKRLVISADLWDPKLRTCSRPQCREVMMKA